MLKKEWFSPAEIAAMKLPGLPGTKSGVQAMANRKGWLRPERQNDQWRPRRGHGGGIEFHYSILPLAACLRLVVLDLSTELAEVLDRIDELKLFADTLRQQGRAGGAR